MVKDPFAGSDFADIAKLYIGLFDLRGAETAIVDLDAYFARFPADAPIRSFNELVARTGVDPFGPGQPLNVLAPALHRGPDGQALPPDISEFLAARERYLRVFDQHDVEHRSGRYGFSTNARGTAADERQCTSQGRNRGGDQHRGLPGVTVPAGSYKSGAPFSLIFVGPLWSESRLLGMAYAYEQHGHHRMVPQLTE